MSDYDSYDAYVTSLCRPCRLIHSSEVADCLLRLRTYEPLLVTECNLKRVIAILQIEALLLVLQRTWCFLRTKIY